MSADKITLDDWLEALADAERASECADGVTSQEIAAATGLGDRVVARLIREGIVAGRIVAVKVRRRFLGGQGHAQRVWGYRLVKQKEQRP